MSDVNETSMSRIVRGQEPPFPQRGKRIADALGWKSDWRELFEEYGECRDQRTLEDVLGEAVGELFNADISTGSTEWDEVIVKYADEIREMMA